MRCGEGIGILHDEFASAHKAIAGAELIAEFILNVIEVDGKLLIAAQLVADKRSNRLLVRGSKDELTAVTVIKAHELLSVSVNSTTFTPELSVDHDRHHELLSIMAVHLVANDVLDFTNSSPGKGKIGVKTGCFLANHAGTKKQTMACKLGLCRVFLERRCVKPGHFHRALSGGHGNSSN